MGMTVSTAGRNAMVDALVDLLDGGSGDATGDLVVTNSSDSIIATCTFSATAFGSASAGTATAASITGDTNMTGGTAARWQARNKSNAEIFRGNVGVSGSGVEMIVSTTTFPAGGSLTISSFTVTQPAGSTT